MEIDDLSSVSSKDAVSSKIHLKKRKKQQQNLPTELNNMFTAAMQTLLKSISFEFDFEQAKLYAASFGLQKEVLSNPLYKESFVLAYLRAYKEYTQLKDVTFHFPYTLDLLCQRYPQLLVDGAFLTSTCRAAEHL